MSAGGIGGLGLVGTLVVLAVGWFFGIDISPLVGAMQGETQQTQVDPSQLSPEQRESGEFVSTVLASTEDVWQKVLPEQTGVQYTDPSMVLYSGQVQSACGGASAAMGPFYCPNDQKVYLDTSFFSQMQDRMGAGGDFAYAYVISHEIGHHIQNLIGVLPKVTQMRQRASEADSNALSVLTELQADCFAGIWGRQASQNLKITQEDFSEAIGAAGAVGDDRLMEGAGRVPMPDSFTHGSSADRQKWFARGFESGEIAKCNTFGEAGL
ncbi:neutral zinc metallopeptidase [Paracoccus suum]